MKKIVVIGVIALFVGVGFQPAFAIETESSADNTQNEDDCGCKEIYNEQQKEYQSYKSSDYKNVYVEIKFNGKHINIPIGFFGFYFFIRVKPLGHGHGWGEPDECTTGRLKIYENGELVYDEYYWDLSVDLILFKGDITLFPIFDYNGGEIKGTTRTIHWSGYPF